MARKERHPFEELLSRQQQAAGEEHLRVSLAHDIATPTEAVEQNVRRHARGASVREREVAIQEQFRELPDTSRRAAAATAVRSAGLPDPLPLADQLRATLDAASEAKEAAEQALPAALAMAQVAEDEVARQRAAYMLARFERYGETELAPRIREGQRTAGFWLGVEVAGALAVSIVLLGVADYPSLSQVPISLWITVVGATLMVAVLPYVGALLLLDGLHLTDSEE